jgi:hypothetical protein
MTQIESVSVQEQKLQTYLNWINRILLVLMLVLALWYYLPSNQQLRGRDVCSYYSIKSKLCNTL